MSILDRVEGTKEAAKRWGRSQDHVKKGCREGWIIAKRIGREYAIDMSQPNPFEMKEKKNGS